MSDSCIPSDFNLVSRISVFSYSKKLLQSLTNQTLFPTKFSSSTIISLVCWVMASLFDDSLVTLIASLTNEYTTIRTASLLCHLPMVLHLCQNLKNYPRLSIHFIDSVDLVPHTHSKRTTLKLY